MSTGLVLPPSDLGAFAFKQVCNHEGCTCSSSSSSSSFDIFPPPPPSSSSSISVDPLRERSGVNVIELNKSNQMLNNLIDDPQKNYQEFKAYVESLGEGSEKNFLNDFLLMYAPSIREENLNGSEEITAVRTFVSNVISRGKLESQVGSREGEQKQGYSDKMKDVFSKFKEEKKVSPEVKRDLSIFALDYLKSKADSEDSIVEYGKKFEVELGQDVVDRVVQPENFEKHLADKKIEFVHDDFGFSVKQKDKINSAKSIVELEQLVHEFIQSKTKEEAKTEPLTQHESQELTSEIQSVEVEVDGFVTSMSMQDYLKYIKENFSFSDSDVLVKKEDTSVVGSSSSALIKYSRATSIGDGYCGVNSFMRCLGRLDDAQIDMLNIKPDSDFKEFIKNNRNNIRELQIEGRKKLIEQMAPGSRLVSYYWADAGKLFQIAQQIGVNLNMIIRPEDGKQNYYNANDLVEAPTIHIVNTSGVHYDAAVVS